MDQEILQNCDSFFNHLLARGERGLVRDMVLATARNSPDDRPEFTSFIANILFRAKCYDEAAGWAERTVALSSHQPGPRIFWAACLNAACRENEAETAIRPLIVQFPALRIDLAIYLLHQGRFAEAQRELEDLMDRMAAQDPSRAIVKFNLHWHWFRQGRFKEAMDAFLNFGPPRNYGLSQPQLSRDEDWHGKRVLVLHENGGAGDEIVNARFAKNLHERGARVFWKSNSGLKPLLERVYGIERVVENIAGAEFDRWTPTGELVRLLDLDIPSIKPEPYLSASPEYLEKWRRKIPATGGLRVGLRWQGHMHNEPDMHRSVPFAEFRKLFDLNGVQFYSLQRDTGVEDISPGDPIVDLSKDLTTWEDTAAAITNLDLVITNCTSIAHLAGALGKKTWLYTPLACFYVWALPGENSPWYPDVRLFRQKKRREWSEVTTAVRRALTELNLRSKA